MFYCQIPADQRPDIAMKPAVDAVYLTHQMNNLTEPDDLQIVDPVEMDASVEEALATTRAAVWGTWPHKSFVVPGTHACPPCHQITIKNSIHGSNINFSEQVDPETFESSYTLLDDGDQPIETTPLIELIVRFVTPNYVADKSRALRGAIRAAQTQLNNIVLSNERCLNLETVWVIDRY